MMRAARLVPLLVPALFLAAMTSPLQAQFLGLTQWNTGPGANSHWYAMSEYAGDYGDVSAVAWSLSGTLVSITSAEENLFVYNSLIGFGSCTYSWCAPATYFIGLERVSVGGPFAWQTGEVVSYTAWNAGEPNDNRTFGPEMVAHAFKGTGDRIVWNDVPYGYPNVMRGVIEWNLDPRSITPVPEPATIILLGPALLALGAIRRRRNLNNSEAD